jgi:hypothetical protein
MRGKIYTRAEADRMVPLLRTIVRSLRSLHRLIHRKQGDLLQEARARDDGRASLGKERDLARLRDAARACVAELDALGCFLRDPIVGIVACYADVEGEIVYLTWQVGADSFDQFHTLDQNWMERQPLGAC